MKKYSNILGGAVSTPVGPKPKDGFVYGIIIDLLDSNPAAITYTDDCVGFVPASGSAMNSWATSPLYEAIKPCLLKSDGTVNYYLRKEDFTKKEDGSASLLTGNDGDVMIEWTKLYWDITGDAASMYIRIGNYKFSDTAVCYAHTDGIVERDKIYVGAYKAAVVSNALYSRSGVAATHTQTISTFRTQAQARGSRYHLVTFYSKMLTSLVGLLLYKNRNIQVALGQGWTASTNTAYGKNTGLLNTQSFNYGNTANGTTQLKLLGMEDYFGGLWEFADGLVCVSWMLKATTETALFSDTGAGFEKLLASGFSANTSDYVKAMHINNEFGVIGKTVGGSEITYWADRLYLNNATNTTTIALFGGAWADARYAGLFLWGLYTAASYSVAAIGSRLCYI